MAVEFEKPYSTDEIGKRPFAVVISLLIGLLLMSVTWNLINDAQAKKQIKDLTDKADNEKTKRIKMYEDMIFYKGEKERLENEQSTSDSLVRERTQLFVHKILSKTK